ncbi:MAG: acyltransferase [Candidatus Krumholzibacteriia bacterium]
MTEIKPLTSLRAFAAFLVFMFHYANVYRPENLGIPFGGEWIPLMPVWRQGPLGVSIFFVLSGFLITRIYYDGMADRRVPLRLFFVKRIARIWPLFLVFACVEHGVKVAQGLWRPHLDFLVTMTMSQGFFYDLRYAGLPTAWSLTVEESFYALAPLVFLAVARLAGRRPAPGALDRAGLVRHALGLAVVTAAMVGLGEVLVRLVLHLGWDWEGFMGSRFHMRHATIFGRFPEFALGMLAAFIHRGVPLPRYLGGRRAPALAITTFGLIGLSMWAKDWTVQHPSAGAGLASTGLSYAVAVLTAVLILALSVDGSRLYRWLSHGLLVYLGKISYGFYLIQLTVLLAPAVALSHRLGYWRVPVLLVLTNLICAGFYQLVEVPARRAIVARWGGRRTTA